MGRCNRKIAKLWLASVIAAATTLAFGATQALAATLIGEQTEPGGSALLVTDEGSDDDAITVSVAGNTITVTETGAGGVAVGAECTEVDPTTVTCPLDPPDPALPAPPKGPVGAVFVLLNGGTDSFTNVNLDGRATVMGEGSGSKTINSGPGDDYVTGGSGNDTINTGAGNDLALAGAGNDSVEMGDGQDFVPEEGFANGADVLNGGGGLGDGVGYSGVFPVTMTLNGQPDDGVAGEGDNLLGFENLSGSQGSDVIAGDGNDNSLSGGEGNDTITGAGGNDEIFPGDGNDSVEAGEGGDFVEGDGPSEEGADLLNGGAGAGDRVEYFGPEPVTLTLNGQADDGRAGEGDNLIGIEGLEGGNGDDVIVGDDANNVLEGNGGNDTLTGAGGTDEFFAGDGDDLLLTRGGRDEVGCGLGFDTPIHDGEDIVNGDCERRGAEVASDSAVANRKGKAKVKITCPAEEGATCKGKLVLLLNGKQIAKGRYSVANGKTKNATVKLTRKGRKALARSKNSALVAAEARTRELQGISINAKQLGLDSKAKSRGKRRGHR